jgi:serine protease Do
MPELVDGGRVRRGWLGVGIQPLTQELAESFGVPGAKGALLNRVVADTPAEEAGLRAGDIVTAVNGQKVADSRELSEAIAALDPGSKAKLTLWRVGAELTLTVELAERPEKDVLARATPRLEPRERGSFGLRLADLTRAEEHALGLSGGARVEEVQPGSPADEAGLAAGDVILSIGTQDVASAEEARELLGDAQGRVRLLVQSRDGSPRWIVIERADR